MILWNSLRGLSVVLILSAPAFGAGVTVRFDPTSPEVGPFPPDALTVPDWNQKTLRRINLPLPDCAIHPTACEQTKILNEYDGFHVNPRMGVRFSDRVNRDTLREGVFWWRSRT